MASTIADVWPRIVAHAGEEFSTVTGLHFAYDVPGNYLRVNRTIRNLSRANFEKALAHVPLGSTRDIQHLQGPSYSYAILMDHRIRRGDW